MLIFLSFLNVTVVIASAETLYPLTVFDAQKVILCITLVSNSREPP